VKTSLDFLSYHNHILSTHYIRAEKPKRITRWSHSSVSAHRAYLLEPAFTGADGDRFCHTDPILRPLPSPPDLPRPISLNPMPVRRRRTRSIPKV